MTSSNKIIVTLKQGGQRLDLFLSARLKITRSLAQKLIEDGRVMINEKPPKKSGERVRKGGVIEISNSKSLISNQISKSKNQKNLAAGSKPFVAVPKILAENHDYLVVEKPTGMLTHPTMAGEKNTLVDFLLKKYPAIKKIGDAPKIRPGIVHRLDKEASGLLVVARTPKMFSYLKEQFKNRTVQKEYYALAHDKVAKDWDEINFPIARGARHERMAARPLAKAKYISTLAAKQDTDPADEEMAPGEKDAKTEFSVVKRFVNFTLLRVTLHTGRMHQIRAHLLAYNHPLVGDPLYFQKKRQSKWDKKLGRLFLHSAKLSFIDLDGERQTFESPLPKKLDEFLKLLK